MPANSMQLCPGQTGICGPAEASGQNHQHQHIDTKKEPPGARIFLLKGKEGTGCDEPTPTPHTPPPPLPPPYSNTLPCHPMPPRTERISRAQRKLGMGKGTSKGREQDRADCTHKKQCRAQKEEKERKESLRLLEAPVRIITLQMHTPARTSQCWSRQTPAWTRSVHLDAPGQRHGQQPVSGTANPGVVKQDKSSGGSVDTTKTHSDPQRVRMSSCEPHHGRGAERRSMPYGSLTPWPPQPAADGETEMVGSKQRLGRPSGED